ncbi:MAG: malate synthase A [Bacteroidetes bacterium]|nr:malate synthase A [Bacteroidota bacterium]MDA1119788.1 malate synthase A [Bacteroidota bacterium]
MNNSILNVAGVKVKGEIKPGFEAILTKDALEFLAGLQRKFNAKRKQLLENRAARQKDIDKGLFPDFLEETTAIRTGEWKVGSIPDDLQDRRTEITGPVDRKMVINALNSGAKVFMADFEDANSPTWDNCIDGQINLRDAIRRQIDFTGPNAKAYKLKDETAVLLVRPRGWHLTEKHVMVDGEQISASIFDFGLYFFHNAKELLKRGSGPYYYIPKLENHKEARLWNDVFIEAQNKLGVSQGSIKVTVLLETILASFEIEEILYELKDHIVGMNAGRWDYIFSAIKKFRNHKDFIFPDRNQVTMNVHFMKSYAELLVKICHKRGAHAIGGMSAFIPAKDEAANQLAFEKVTFDKSTEASQGYDGTWGAHPFLVPIAMEQFNRVLGDYPHQKHVLKEDLEVNGKDLITTHIEGGKISEDGLRLNINVGLLYIESWLQGIGAAALYNLMEDAATAEISRAQVWQWLHNDGVKLDDGREINWRLYEQFFEEEKQKAAVLLGTERTTTGKLEIAARLFDKMVREEDFKDFLTLDAYEEL